MKRMNLVRVLAIGLASAVVVACGREQTPEQIAPAIAASAETSETNVTSATVSDRPAVTSEETVCLPVANGAPAANAPVSPVRPLKAAVAPRTGKSARAPRALNDAIADEVDALADTADESPSAPEAASAPPTGVPVAGAAATPVSTQVTLTGGTVPAASHEESLRGARVAFDSRLPKSYELERIRFLVDGRVAYDGKAGGSVGVPSGDHVVEVIADYRLHDPVFSYVDGYRVELKSTQVLPASRTPVAFVATAVPAGGVTTPMNKRAALTWRSFPEGK